MARTRVAPLRHVLCPLLNVGVCSLLLAACLVVPATAWAVKPAAAEVPIPVGAGGAGGAPHAHAAPGSRRALLIIEVSTRRALVDRCNTAAATPLSCDIASLDAIDAARAGEDLPPLVLPSDYEDLSVVNQLVAVTNAERLPRDLPAMDGPDQALGALAGQGVASGQDPNGPQGTTWVSNLATGVLTVLEADYEWMYNDGPGGTNSGCTTVGQSSCWAHRANILSPWAGAMGAAWGTVREHRLVLAEVMVRSR